MIIVKCKQHFSLRFVLRNFQDSSQIVVGLLGLMCLEVDKTAHNTPLMGLYEDFKNGRFKHVA